MKLLAVSYRMSKSTCVIVRLYVNGYCLVPQTFDDTSAMRGFTSLGGALSLDTIVRLKS